jgi:hypothetical protein
MKLKYFLNTDHGEKMREYNNKRVVRMTSCSLDELAGTLIIATQMQGSLNGV